MKREKIAPAVIQYFPLDQLHLSDLNPRQDAEPEGIDLLADSLAMIGLVQNLSGLADAETGKIGIVAGGRRLRAIARAIERDPAVVERQPTLAQIPVQITFDRETARAWASAENSAREDLDPADEIRAYGRMKESGADVPTIARTFGQTEAQVYRRLALAALPAEVLDALKSRQISLGMAKAFTVSQDPVLTLKVLDSVHGKDASEHRIKLLLQPDTVSGRDRRALFVGVDAYKAAGGTLAADLFSDQIALHNPDLLSRLFAEKLEDDAAAACDGWHWFEIMEGSYVPYGASEKMKRLYRVEGVLGEEQSERYDELAELANGEALDEAGKAELAALQAILDGDYTEDQRRFGGWLVYVDDHGRLRKEGPYVKPQDRKAATEAGVLTGHAAYDGGEDTAPKSPYSAALVEDLKAMRLAAVQGALLDKPQLALDLAAYTLAQVYGGPLDLRTSEGKIHPSTTTGFAPDPRLSAPVGDEPGDDDQGDEEEDFAAFRAKGQKHRNTILTLALARALKYGCTDFWSKSPDPLFDAIEGETKASVRKVWTPNAENFFNRVTGDYLDALLLELTGADPEGNGFKNFKKEKKGDKARQLERLFTDPEYQRAWHIDAEKKAVIDAWTPDCF